MITDYEKFKIVDESGKGKHLLMEVNWAPENTETNQCKVLKLTYPNGEQAFVKKEYLNSMMFAIGSPAEQRKMIPQTITRTRWYETTVGVKATKDIRKGEMINFPVKFSMPAVEEEVIGERSPKTKK